MRIAKIPDHTSIEEVKSAIKKQIGDVVCLELDKNGGAMCTIDVRITDKEFYKLWSIKGQDFEIIIAD